MFLQKIKSFANKFSNMVDIAPTQDEKKRFKTKEVLNPSTCIENISHKENSFIYCQKCGSKLPENARFCNKCGQALNQFEPPKTNNLKYKNLTTCKSCGALVAKTAKACPKCGAKTPNQLIGEAVQGIGCGLLAFPLFFIVMVIYVVLWSILK